MNQFEPASGRAAALAPGFVQEVVPAGDQVDRALEPCGRDLRVRPLAVREIKRAAQVYLEEGEQAAYREIPAMRARTANSADFAEGSFRSSSVARRSSRGAERGRRPRRAASAALPGYIVGASDCLRSIWQDRAAFADKPALLLWGLKDIAFRRKEQERWRSALRDVEVREFEDCGHFVAEEAPGRVVEGLHGAVVGVMLRQTSALGRSSVEATTSLPVPKRSSSASATSPPAWA